MPQKEDLLIIDISNSQQHSPYMKPRAVASEPDPTPSRKRKVGTVL
jgi:hypothetical protein